MPPKTARQPKGNLDKVHMERVNQFRQAYDELEDQKTQLAACRTELSELLAKPSLNSPAAKSGERRTPSEEKRVVRLREYIRRLEGDIDHVEGGTDSLDYIMSTMSILSDRYNQPEEVKMRVAVTKQPYRPNDIESIILSHSQGKNGGFTQDVEELSNTFLYDDYIYATEGRKNTVDTNQCPEEDCLGMMALTEDESAYVCDVCGYSEPNMVLDRTGSEYVDRGKCTYCRANHLSEMLDQIQARETTAISDDIINDIYADIQKHNYDISKLYIGKMKKILKRLGHRKYYEHCPYILQKITGIPPASFTPEQEHKLKLMFHQVEEQYPKAKPDGRHNFLSYGYVMRKCLQLIGLESHMDYFKKLSHIKKLVEHDETWRKICALLNWEYVSSF